MQYLEESSWDPESGLPVLLMELMDGTCSLNRFLERSEGPLPFHIRFDLSPCLPSLKWHQTCYLQQPYVTNLNKMYCMAHECATRCTGRDLITFSITCDSVCLLHTFTIQWGASFGARRRWQRSCAKGL